ncbi:MAG: hypothetical protein LBK54_01495 [Propionibacteriaceae bacterium]|jgi:hypothetical protein|nr:hypothetical protein [Propionibacteriaceae bacterium]
MNQSIMTIDYCGIIHRVQPGAAITLGREADIVLDEDNPFLHRVFLSIQHEHGLWWLKNVGSNLSATVSANGGAVQAWLAPGGSLPLVFPQAVVWFTAGETTYDFDLSQAEAIYESAAWERANDGDCTIGNITLTIDQRLLILALAEDILRRGNRGAGSIPTSAEAARRLDWQVTKFNRKLDNVCSKLADLGVRGLHGGPGRLASSRKARLVEYALGTGIVTQDDLGLLPPRGSAHPSPSPTGA